MANSPSEDGSRRAAAKPRKAPGSRKAAEPRLLYEGARERPARTACAHSLTWCRAAERSSIVDGDVQQLAERIPHEEPTDPPGFAGRAVFDRHLRLLHPSDRRVEIVDFDRQI
jgi:hypothetical protein